MAVTCHLGHAQIASEIKLQPSYDPAREFHLTRIFFTSDVHGSETCFMKFLNAAKFYRADTLVLGGDITGKIIVPIVEQGDGTYVAQFLGIQEVMKSKEESEGLEKKIRSSGFYPYRTTPSEVEKLENQKESLDELFSKIMVESVKRWVSIAEDRLRGTNVKCYISPGNDDRFDIDAVLKSSPVVLCPEDEVVSVDTEHEMITSAWTNYTPWHSPRETSEDKLAEIFEGLTARVQRMENCIFNLHCPPFDTTLDVAPEIDRNFKPVTKSGTLSMIHVGSKAVRQAIEKHRPLLGLHGHIHESRGFATIGRTLCVNPGSTYADGILLGALLNLESKGVKSYMLTQG
jgi:Icc-related predicted phosphoesterase